MFPGSLGLLSLSSRHLGFRKPVTSQRNRTDGETLAQPRRDAREGLGLREHASSAPCKPRMCFLSGPFLLMPQGQSLTTSDSRCPLKSGDGNTNGRERQTSPVPPQHTWGRRGVSAPGGARPGYSKMGVSTDTAGRQPPGIRMTSCSSGSRLSDLKPVRVLGGRGVSLMIKVKGSPDLSLISFFLVFVFC